MSYDYGPYSNRLEEFAGGADRQNLNYSGIAGHTVTSPPRGQSYGGRNVTAVHFGRISNEYEEWNGLTTFVLYRDPADEALARCIISSIEWVE